MDFNSALYFEQLINSELMLGPVITALTRQFPILDPLPFTKFTLKNFANPTQCYANAEKPSDCVAPKDDYMECLHNTKEVSSLSGVKMWTLRGDGVDV